MQLVYSDRVWGNSSSTNYSKTLNVPALLAEDLVLVTSTAYGNGSTLTATSSNGATFTLDQTASIDTYGKSQLWHRVATAAEAAHTITVSSGSTAEHKSIALMVFRKTGFQASVQRTSGVTNAIVTPAITTADADYILHIASAVGVSGTGLATTGQPTGWTLHQDYPGIGSGAYTNVAIMGQAYGGGAAPTPTWYWNQGASTAIFAVTLKTLNTPPTVAINTIGQIDPRVNNTITWNFSDSDGDTQQAFEMEYRLPGGTWTNIVSGTTAISATIPANTLTDETDYELRVRVSDGKAWSDYDTETFRADSWTYFAETPSATESAVLSAATLDTNSDYEVQVKVSDGFDYSDWVGGDMIFTRQYVYENGEWKATVKRQYWLTNWRIGR